MGVCHNFAAQAGIHVIRRWLPSRDHGPTRSDSVLYQRATPLWLGHESVETTQIYLDADLAFEREGAREDYNHQRQKGTFRPDDELLNFLKNL
jgi:hypothetical protein